MKIMKYAAVAAIAIGLCAGQCRALTADAWLKQYVVDKNLNDEQKKLVAAFLFWKIRAHDAAAKKVEAAEHADTAAMSIFNTYRLGALAIVKSAAEDMNSTNSRSLYESSYVALWNLVEDDAGNTFGDRVLKNKPVPYNEIVGLSKRFVKPVDGKVRPLYP